MKDLFAKKDLIYTVYQEKSVSRAANKLFISQPSLSAIIKKAEDDIGLPLFDRGCKPIRLTDVGVEYIKATEAIRHIETTFSNYIDSVNALQTGTLTVGSNQLLSSLVLPKYISRFISAYPQVQLNLVDDNSVTLRNMISSGQLDLIIDNQSLDLALFEQRHFQTEHLLLAVPAFFTCNQGLDEYQLRERDIKKNRHTSIATLPVDLNAFADIPFIFMTHDNDTRSRTEAVFHEYPWKPHVLFEIDRLSTLYHFVEIGTAAAIVSDTLVKNLQHHSGNVLFYRLAAPCARREIYISYKRSKYYSRPMQAFMDLLTSAN